MTRARGSLHTHLPADKAVPGADTQPWPRPDPLPREMEKSGESRRTRQNRATGAAEERDLERERPPGSCAAPADQEKMDNYGDVGDLIQQEENLTTDPGGAAVLPGEVEEDEVTCPPLVCHVTQLEMTTTARNLAARAEERQEMQELLSKGDEVVPFCLDEDFDYDHVVLSHKHPITESSAGSLQMDRMFCVEFLDE